MHTRRRLLSTVLTLPLLALSLQAAQPTVGDKVPDFTLTSFDGKQTALAGLYEKGPVALVVLRGYPGYQCPFCQRQVQEFVEHAAEFDAAGIQVVFVYPGPPDQLQSRVAEALTGKNFPASYTMLLDPGYAFTTQYGLRWDGPNETAYPSTFLISKGGAVFYAQIAKLHSGRTSAATILSYFPKKKG